ncbi:hypothetical protein M2R47_00530 [Moraxella sp. Tifton1]|uniref:Uncharacterized protein n=1 Tax=Moraxella oculi TaxID=2940516 RepID=A0ABW8U450_9GAMM|nr:hypothetical protein [Moraxella sp. Tifton1]MCL1622742.1 hypothetical protein [Moraxella sp. Tifton1]
MFDKADDDLIQQLIEETETIIEELQDQLKTQQNDVEECENSIDHMFAQTESDLGKGCQSRSQDVNSQKQTSSDRKEPTSQKKVNQQKSSNMMVKEAVLEFVEREDGVLSLQEVGSEDDPMVTIVFSEQVKEMVGKNNIQMIGQSMIHAAIAAVMQRQLNAWHAHVYDEVPKHYS